VRRFRAQLVLFFAALLVAHAQCLLACAVDECRQAAVPPCHRHHPTKNCNQDQFVSAQPPAVKLAAAAIGPAPAPLAAIALEPSVILPVPDLSPPGPEAVRLRTPLRI
jgi:hypothetical protein